MASPQARALATRLRTLRKEAWPSRPPVTQQQLASALFVSVPAISGWENTNNPTVPGLDKLQNYARFFATPRSLEGGTPRLIDLAELTEVELVQHDQLNAELARLYAAVRSPQPASTAVSIAPVGTGFWHFADGAPVTIMCSQLPVDLRADARYADPDSPDYVELFSYADLDALMELHGHIRAANPDSAVTRVLASDAKPNLLTTHLVILGGVDWNPITREAFRRLNIPVQQGYRDEHDDEGAFTVLEGNGSFEFRPTLATEWGRRVLVEDVGHFYYGSNPFNHKRTVTICNAMFGRGVYGMVRTLTDERFRDRNTAYLRDKFAPGAAVSLLTRVQVVMGNVVTPDWTNPDTVLHEWSEASS